MDVLLQRRQDDGMGGSTTLQPEVVKVKVPARKLGWSAPQDMIVNGQVRQHEYAEFTLDHRRSGDLTGNHYLRTRDQRLWEVLSVQQQDHVIWAKCRDLPNPEHCKSS